MSTFTATGSFSVSTTPQGQRSQVGDFNMGTYLVQKVFQGDLDATSKFEMHTAGTEDGAACYIAMEAIAGTLQGKTGSFLLIHTGTMSKSGHSLVINVASGCSTGELKGMEGKFTINQVGKEHFYVFEYSLPG
ncbi:MAG: DUF3224 domain-containing protein [Bacteroidota bacterium]